jgi:hypothetical protein
MESAGADGEMPDSVDAGLETESFAEGEAITDEFTADEEADLAMLADSGELPDFDDLADDPTFPNSLDESNADLAEEFAAEDLPDDWSGVADDVGSNPATASRRGRTSSGRSITSSGIAPKPSTSPRTMRTKRTPSSCPPRASHPTGPR